MEHIPTEGVLASPAAELTYEEKLARAKAAHALEVASITAEYDRIKQALVDPVDVAPTPPPPRAANRHYLTQAQQEDHAKQLRASWRAFLDADEVSDAMAAYSVLRGAAGVPEGCYGQAVFDAIERATTECPEVPHKEKNLMRTLAGNWALRPVAGSGLRIVVSGAGPVGLRAAVEGALMGTRVHVLEMRETFSRVNILTLWQPTADDLMSYGAHLLYPKFTNRRVGTSPLHLGTREIQLVLLKNALLLGVQFHYGAQLVAVQAPRLGEHPGGHADEGQQWTAWVQRAASTSTHQTRGGALDFKPNKMGEYVVGVGQGKCNLLDRADLDASFALESDAARPEGIEALPFDALLLAEGEWSTTCKRLGIGKSIDRFTQAIGLVINMVVDPHEPATKAPYMRSFNISPLDTVGKELLHADVHFEFGEYLRGETHYIVLSLKKTTLLGHGVLFGDLPGAALLTKGNLDEGRLMALARKVATLVGLPATTAFAAYHPAKLFDYSSRARCLAGFRVLAVRDGGAAAGRVLSMDLEAHPYLRSAETQYHARARAEADAELAKRAEERLDLEGAIRELKEVVQVGVQAQLAPAPPPRLGRMYGLSEMAAQLEATRAVSSSVEAGVEALPGPKGLSTCDGSAAKTYHLSAFSAQAMSGEAAYQARKEANDWTPEERLQMAVAQLGACERSLVELAEKTRIQQKTADACKAKQAEWAERTASALSGYSRAVPVFPIGDSLLEPFWPQGLGSNRGFHSALDAVWAVHVLQQEGLEAALLERNFFYDLMLQGPWQPPLLKPAKGWWADPVSRYADAAILRHKSTYTDLASKRLYRGAGATPLRIEALRLQAERGSGLSRLLA